MHGLLNIHKTFSCNLYLCIHYAYFLSGDVVDIGKPEVILSDCNGTVLDIIKRYSQMHCTDKYLQHSSIIWPLWLNVWVFVYEIIGCGFKSCWSHLNFRYCACLEQGVSWHSGKHRVWIHLWMGAWHDKNIQSEGIYPSAFVVDEFWGLFLHPSVFSIDIDQILMFYCLQKALKCCKSLYFLHTFLWYPRLSPVAKEQRDFIQ